MNFNNKALKRERNAPERDKYRKICSRNLTINIHISENPPICNGLHCYYKQTKRPKKILTHKLDIKHWATLWYFHISRVKIHNTYELYFHDLLVTVTIKIPDILSFLISSHHHFITFWVRNILNSCLGLYLSISCKVCCLFYF